MLDKTSIGPLEGVKVLELGSLIAGPFAGRLFADFGAEVLKVEPPKKGDPIRKWRLLHNDNSLWWYVQSRNKKSITLDLKNEDAQEVIKELVKEVDIVIENFRPGMLEKWGLGYEELKQINPKIIMVRVSGYGQDGPYKDRPGFGSIGEAMGGIRYLTGYPDLPPTRVGISLGDSVTALYAVIGALMALRHRDQVSGEGQVVDVALYEAIYSLMESTVPEYDKFGAIRERTGSTLPGIAPSNIYLCKDGKYVVIGANGDGIFKRLMVAINRQDVLENPLYETNDGRSQDAEYLDSVIGEWTKSLDIESALNILEENGIPAGSIFSVEDMFKDPHYQAREMIVDLDVEDLGKLKVPGIIPKLSKTPGQIRWAGPKLGEHTDEILKEKVGLTDEQIEKLKGLEVIK
ncbi:formyl-CoA transferase [Lysinibacillus composti]|uniref:CoA transferase n=1 Tax=Lysinibacillus composti TaxID=720633 RepID=A0A3N9UFK7_9BACI|nr:CaiB/BaiF CoA-transferase family protein [Lysinibacillus composti]MBM7608415.1 formyl-CoA transferase [Lysinibacillus composti]RQW74911.1 CoA transferase [Lysinibacillus composti]